MYISLYNDCIVGCFGLIQRSLTKLGAKFNWITVSVIVSIPPLLTLPAPCSICTLYSCTFFFGCFVIEYNSQSQFSAHVWGNNLWTVGNEEAVSEWERDVMCFHCELGNAAKVKCNSYQQVKQIGISLGFPNVVNWNCIKLISVYIARCSCGILTEFYVSIW